MKASFFKKLISFASVLTMFTMLLAGCGGGGDEEAKEEEKTETEGAGGAEGTLEQAYAGEFKGSTVTMFGPFTDADQVKFENSIKEFEEKTGIDIQYEGSKEFEATISIRVEGGNAPDIADFPQPGLLATFAKQGLPVDVSTFLEEDYLKEQYNQSWLDMATMEGKDGEEYMTGIWNRSNVKSLVWYPKAEFEAAGYKIPETWEEMLELSDQIAADGDSAWAIGIESGAATGWPATDWIEDIMLRTTTPENYDKWVTGELPFTSPEVKNAFEVMSNLWFTENYVYGGRKSIVTTSFGDAPKPLFDSPPSAYMHRQGSFITSFFPEGTVAGEDYDWFYLPPINEEYGKPVLVAGDIYAMFNDRPEVRAVMEFFTKGESIKSWIQSGGVVGPMNDADPEWYTTDVERRMAELVQNADTIRFDGSDLMPGSVGAGTFWKGITDYVSGNVELEQALEEIQAGFNK
ncbi:alpha-glucoside transport system substrate-binding protein [Bacillus mesophilus]|uniref:Carbohydrate ABC transporter substrate-binding protein n=1 Tax=Bacillus mesophilus TaxID=1808955 RepID=A0A6M0Q2W0_9BACI|nr:ABC transporter substrate-binding protein [Bacillus mesophilus]MBM7659862.1 alpha-glucoside transport system substrate-binding protein [Bacillus mesophilus]NEY70721.1 carbohydrate ABC transporter substrate-binding protein [Bacillus mesophilus]